jgi:hypothetical protein
MSAALAPIGPRLGQLIRMLGSDRDGEVLSAARALGRTLRSINADFHDLAAAIEREAPSANHGPSDHRTMAHWILRSGARLSETERGFVHQMANWRGEPSERQASWLLSIFERASSSERRRA